MISFWEKQWFKRADFVVVGAGIVGLQCATKIKKRYPQREVWILDRAPLSFGASTRNAGFACFGSLGELVDDASNIGMDKALTLYAMRYEGFKKLAEENGAVQIGYEPTGGTEIFTAKQNSEFNNLISNIEEINQNLKSINNENQTFRVKPSQHLGMNVLPECIFTPLEGAIQTHLLYQSLYQKALDSGVKIYGGVNIDSIEPQANQKWEIKAGTQFQISAKNVIICTNGFTRNLFPEMEVYPARGQVMVTAPIPDLKWRGLIHADKGYIYCRSLGTRILIGGGRNQDFSGEETYSLETTDNMINYLKNYLSEIVIPNTKFEIKDSWSGTMGMNTNRLPIVEKKEKGLYFCVKMGGMGVALSALVSQQLCDLLEN